MIYDPATELVWMSDYLRAWGWDSRIEWEKAQLRKVYNLRWIGPILERLTDNSIRRRSIPSDAPSLHSK
jgi:hypothetical protein